MREKRKLVLCMFVIVFIFLSIAYMVLLVKQNNTILSELNAISFQIRELEKESKEEFGDYLSIYQASNYIKIDVNEIERLIAEGEMKGVYIVDKNGENVFSKSSLKEWFDVTSENLLFSD